MRTSAHDVIEFERRIAARPETVFSYFTDPARYRLWQGVDAELDARPGGLFRVTMTGRTGAVASGAYVELDPPRRLVFTWGWEQHRAHPDAVEAFPPGTSTVEVELVADGDATILHLRHSGLPTELANQFHSFGWTQSLDRLVVAAAGGDPGPNPFADA